jgi:hypothetical protein
VKVIVNHVLHFHSGGRTYVAVARPGVQEVPDWIEGLPVYEVGLWAGYLRPVEQPAVEPQPEPAQPVAAKRGRRRAR